MFDTKTIDDIASRLTNAMPSGINNLKDDMEKNFRVVLQTALGKLDLVTREEFEVQKGVLAKTRAKLETLEQQVAEIEKRFVDKAE
jgi:ubiquinone biosynthesis accessory factor UbiK